MILISLPKYFFILVLCLFSFTSLAQTQADSLIVIAEKSTIDTAKVHLYNQICVLLRDTNMDKSLEYANKAKELATTLNFERGLGNSLGNIGWIYYRKGDYAKAFDISSQTLKIGEKIGDWVEVGKCLNNIASVYNAQNNFKTSLEYFEKAYQINAKIGDKTGMGRSLNNLAFTAYKANLLDTALNYGEKALKHNIDLGNQYYIAFALRTLGDIHINKNNYKKALEVCLASMEIAKKTANNFMIITNLQRIAKIYQLQNEHKKAVLSLEQGIEIAKRYGFRGELEQAYLTLATSHQKLNNYSQAFDYQAVYIKLHDSLYNEENSKKIAALQTQFETARKESEIVLLKKDQIIQQDGAKLQRLVLIIAFGGLATLLILLSILVWRFQEKKAANLLLTKQKEELDVKNKAIHEQKEELMQQTEELNQANEELNTTLDIVHEQKAIIETKNKNTTDSIMYARRIQRAVLPITASFDESFGAENYFILFRPRDIVSGDFYWLAEKAQGQKIIFAVADCTGHGVPGAFMSMVGDSLLNNIVHDKEIHEPHHILQQLHEGIRTLLHQDRNDSRDGMNISIVVIDKNAKTFTYAGAMSNLWYYENNGNSPQILTEIRANRFPIGGHTKHDETRVFTQHTIDYQPNTILYLRTDGYADQFGGEFGKKIMSRNLKNLITENADKSMQTQLDILSENLDTWQNWEGRDKKTQIDDITLVGIRI